MSPSQQPKTFRSRFVVYSVQNFPFLTALLRQTAHELGRGAAMNWLDIIIGLILIVSVIAALRNGLSREFVNLLALAVGIVGGMWWYGPVAERLEPYLGSERVAEFAAFALILVAALIAGAVAGRVLAKMLGWVGLRWFDRLLGGAFGALRGLLLTTALILAIVAFGPLQGSERVVAESRLAPWVLFAAQACVRLAPRSFHEDFSEGFERVRKSWIDAAPDSIVRR